MGQCLGSKRASRNRVNCLPEPAKLTYAREVRTENCEIRLESATTATVKVMELPGIRLFVSGKLYVECTLPCHEPTEHKDPGSDIVVVEGRSQAVLLGLLDGQGATGKVAAKVCKDTCVKAFQQSQLPSDMYFFLENTITDCETRLKNTEEVKSVPYSGT